MTKNATMQFYLLREINEKDLIDELNALLGMRVESIDEPDEQAIAFLMTSKYETGFIMAVNLSWRAELTPKYDELELAKRLALCYHTYVATDLPASDPDASNPFYWSVAKPDGTVEKMVQDTSTMSPDAGLILTSHFSGQFEPISTNGSGRAAERDAKKGRFQVLSMPMSLTNLSAHPAEMEPTR